MPVSPPYGTQQTKLQIMFNQNFKVCFEYQDCLILLKSNLQQKRTFFMLVVNSAKYEPDTNFWAD